MYKKLDVKQVFVTNDCIHAIDKYSMPLSYI